jgi:flavin reductase (DIM6/NTAB) family NADH-FMN oxidoreductase RutF
VAAMQPTIHPAFEPNDPNAPRAVELPKAYRLLNHGPTVLVTSAHAGRINVMAAAWNSGLDFTPAKVMVVIDKSTFTRELVEASGGFALNVPVHAIARETRNAGAVSGRDVAAHDKFAHLGLEHFRGARIDVPLVKGCVGWLECKVIREPHNEKTYDLFIGEVLAAWADPRVFSEGHWHFDGHNELRTIHYVAGGTFLAIGEEFEVDSPSTKT